MRRIIAIGLMLVTTGVASAQAPADPHAHPSPAPGQTAPQAQAPGHGGGGTMGMMGDMPMMGMMHHMMMTNMMRQMGMMGPGGAAMSERIEGRIAFLRAELKITDAQATAWNGFADALRANARKLAEVRAAQRGQTLAQRLDAQEQWLTARLEGTRALKTALAALAGSLSEEQKRAAEELLSPHLGLTMMPMMGGRMSHMQPGQAMPPGR